MAESSLPKIKVLDNSNYNEWCGDMQPWLMSRGYWRLVIGKEVKPSKEEESLKWEEKAMKAAGEIYLCVGSDQKQHLKECLDDPVAMWATLEKIHVSKKPGARFNAYDELFSIVKSEEESLQSLGDRVGAAMNQIKRLRPKNFTIEMLDKELEAMALIRSLPGEYSHLSANLLLQDNLDKDIVLGLFRAEELNQKKREQSLNKAASLMASRGPIRGVGRPGGQCWNCGDKGHWANRCPKPRKGIQAKKAQAEADGDVVENAGCASAFSFNQLRDNFSDIVQWNTDTGATSHMTPHKSWIRNYTPYRVPVRLADNRVVYSEGVGSVLFSPIIKGQVVRDVEFTRVLHVPALNNNLLSVLYLTKHRGFHVHINRDLMEFSLNNTVLFTASVNDRSVGYLNGHTVSTSGESVHVVSTLPLNLELWHRRFFHCNLHDVQKMSKDELVEGFKLDSKAMPDPICELCLAGKMHANPFLSSHT